MHRLRPARPRVEVPDVLSRGAVSDRGMAATLTEVTQRDGCCVRCGGNFRLSAHHVIPRAEGGADHPSNLVALCVTCHRAETAREHAEQRR